MVASSRLLPWNQKYFLDSVKGRYPVIIPLKWDPKRIRIHCGCKIKTSTIAPSNGSFICYIILYTQFSSVSK